MARDVTEARQSAIGSCRWNGECLLSFAAKKESKGSKVMILKYKYVVLSPHTFSR